MSDLWRQWTGQALSELICLLESGAELTPQARQNAAMLLRHIASLPMLRYVPPSQPVPVVSGDAAMMETVRRCISEAMRVGRCDCLYFSESFGQSVALNYAGLIRREVELARLPLCVIVRANVVVIERVEPGGDAVS